MERTAQAGSNGRWYVREGNKVVAGPYSSQQLASSLAAHWNRCRRTQAPRPVVTRASASYWRPLPAMTERELEWVSWIGELLMEHNGDVDSTWQYYLGLNEHFDGETGETAAARVRFYRAVPLAQFQNQLIHGWA